MVKQPEDRITLIQESLGFLSEISVVIVGFLILVTLNLATFFLGPSRILRTLSAHTWGIIFTPFVFDSWGTIGGLLGVTILFSPVLLATHKNERKSLSLFFMLASVSIGLLSTLIWNYDFNNSGAIPFGSSSIDISAQAIIFTLSIIALSTVMRRNPYSDKYIRDSFVIIYLTLISTTLWFILFLEPIFIPSNQYNWRVHEIAFLIGTFCTVIYALIRWTIS